MAEFFILRHGETLWNVEGRMQGGLDSPLTDRGRMQARMQGDILRAAGAANLPVHCSPSGRAVETAGIALPGSSLTLEPRLAEVGMGGWQGLSLDEIERRWPWALDHPHPFVWKFSAPGGETFTAMQGRIENWLVEVSGPVVVVTHGVTSQLIRGALIGCDLDGMAELEDRQGVVYHVLDGREDILDPRL